MTQTLVKSPPLSMLEPTASNRIWQQDRIVCPMIMLHYMAKKGNVSDVMKVPNQMTELTERVWSWVGPA